MQSQNFGKVLKRLPAWAVTNLSEGSRVPLQPGIFDLVIIDEASQCDIAIVCSMVRGSRTVVIGDPLQLSQISNVSMQRKTSLFPNPIAKYRRQFDHLIYTQKSLFMMLQNMLLSRSYTFLSNHYRCHSDIIKFANTSHWYGRDALEIFTHEESLKRPDWWDKGIIWEQVRIVFKFCRWWKVFYQRKIDHAVSLVQQLEKRNYEGIFRKSVLSINMTRTAFATAVASKTSAFSYKMIQF